MTSEVNNIEGIENSEILLDRQLEKIHNKILQEVEKNVPELPPERRFESVVHLRNKAKIEAQKNLDELRHIMDMGFDSIIKILREMNNPESSKEIIDWFQGHLDEISKYIGSDKPSSEVIDADQTFEKQLNFPFTCMDAMYHAAKRLYEDKRYEEANAAILVCLQISPVRYPFWLLYASILQRRGEYETSLQALQMAAVLNKEDPQIYAEMVKSHLALNRWNEAENDLKEAHMRCVNNFANFTHYCDEIEALMIEYKRAA